MMPHLTLLCSSFTFMNVISISSYDYVLDGSNRHLHMFHAYRRECSHHKHIIAEFQIANQSTQLLE